MTVEFRTVLIGVDCTTRFEAALESGVELARVLQLGLAGYFVEEEALLDFSSLPFSSVVQSGRGGPRPLDAAAMRRALAREGARLRAELERRAREFDLRWRFEVGRGRTAEALGRAAQAGDIVVLPTARGAADFRARLEIAAALVKSGRAALLAPDRARPAGRAVVALVEAAEAEVALTLAARIAARIDAPLAVQAWADDAEEIGAVKRGLAELPEGAVKSVELVARGAGETLDAEALEAAAPRLIVSHWRLMERRGLFGPESPLRRSGAGMLLLPDPSG